MDLTQLLSGNNETLLLIYNGGCESDQLKSPSAQNQFLDVSHSIFFFEIQAIILKDRWYQRIQCNVVVFCPCLTLSNFPLIPMETVMSTQKWSYKSRNSFRSQFSEGHENFGYWSTYKQSIPISKENSQIQVFSLCFPCTRYLKIFEIRKNAWVWDPYFLIRYTQGITKMKFHVCPS